VNLDGSERIDDFENLKAYIESDEFIKNKAYLTQKPKSRWEQSDEFAALKEYETLKSSEKIVWYFKNIDSKIFAWHRVWSETFLDDFSSASLDTKKWLTRYYWGEKMLKDSYSLSHDKHFITDGKNIELNQSKLQIITKKEAIRGKSWDHSMGFITRDFGYTSGLINTAQSFRQLYGTFEAKIKVHSSTKIQNAFWMVSQTIVPHIDIVKAKKKIFIGNAWGDPKDLKTIKQFIKSKSRSKLSSDFFIYSFEWTPQRLTWKINGLEIASTSQGIPQEPMYIVLSAGLQHELDNVLPAKMEVDWVRCFQHKDY
jgi:beta-glucanase (GH16 family)